MNFIIDRSDEKYLTKTMNFLTFNNYKILTTGNVSIAIVFIKSHNDLMDESFKNIIYRYINEKTPYVLVSQTQDANIQLNCLNTFLNLKIDISPLFDDYDLVYDYIKELDKNYKKMFSAARVNNATKKVKFSLKKTQEKAQDEIETKIKKLKLLLDD